MLNFDAIRSDAHPLFWLAAQTLIRTPSARARSIGPVTAREGLKKNYFFFFLNFPLACQEVLPNEADTAIGTRRNSMLGMTGEQNE